VKQFLYGYLGVLVILLGACEMKVINEETPAPIVEHQANQATISPPVGKFDRTPFVYDTAKKYIYLTFDDGPQHGTLETFGVCRDNGIKATYFMVGLHSQMRKDGNDIVAKIKNAYPQFLLANHSYTHALGKYQSFYQHADQTVAEFLKAQDTLKVPYKIIRLPGNNAWVLKDSSKKSHLVSAVCHGLDSLGYNIIGWDSEWTFGHTTGRPVQTATQMADQIVNLLDKNETFTKNHLVLLTHDRIFHRPEDLDSLNKMIVLLKQRPNYVFETIDHYPGLKW
jgi:peptidoglycan/xylan/chitin deacetylase (PgdA/CDA1 family)